MVLIILAWIFLFFLCLSIGAGSLKLISRFAGNNTGFGYEIFYQFWFGFVVLIALLQLLSLFLPINTVVFTFTLLLAIFFAVVNYKDVLINIRLFYNWVTTVKGLFSFLIILALLILVSYSANREVLHGDTFLYHYNGVKWAREYPAVPGLANLHSRLGFNSSFFLFAALTEIGVYVGNSAHVALSFLMIACTIHWFLIITNPKELAVKRIFCMLTSLFLLIHIVTQIDITSLSTDYPMAILTLVFCVLLVDKVDHKIILLLPLSAVVFAFKLSGMLTVGFAFIVFLEYLYRLKYRNREIKPARSDIRIYATSFFLLVFIVSGFVIRNIIVSGWLIFPFPVGNLHLPWSVPTPYALDAMNWVESYAKVPGGASPAMLKEHPPLFWIPGWLSKFKLTMEFDMACGAFFILSWALFQIDSVSKFIKARLNLLLLVLFSMASILFWFFSAPEMRFGAVHFFIFFAASTILLFEASRHKDILINFIYILFICQIVYRIPSYYVDRTPKLFTFEYTQQRKLIQVIASPPDEKPALKIYMPLVGDGCGDSPIPCTPYAGGYVHNHRLIRQRVPGDLSKGFLPTK